MSEHELTVVPYAENYLGECVCGWVCQRSRDRDVRRMFRTHLTEAATADMWRHLLFGLKAEGKS